MVKRRKPLTDDVVTFTVGRVANNEQQKVMQRRKIEDGKIHSEWAEKQKSHIQRGMILDFSQMLYLDFRNEATHYIARCQKYKPKTLDELEAATREFYKPVIDEIVDIVKDFRDRNCPYAFKMCGGRVQKPVDDRALTLSSSSSSSSSSSFDDERESSSMRGLTAEDVKATDKSSTKKSYTSSSSSSSESYGSYESSVEEIDVEGTKA